MAEAVKYKRTRYLVAKKFQLKYIGLILALVLLTGLLCSYVVYYTTMLLLGDKLANVYPQGRLISIVNTVNIRILLSLILVAPLVITIGVFASHRIAGPISRVEKFLGDMANGDYTSILTMRKNDELISLTSGINHVIDNVKGMVKAQRSHLDKAAVSLENLKNIAESKPMNHSMLIDAADKLGAELVEVSRELEKYKI